MCSTRSKAAIRSTTVNSHVAVHQTVTEACVPKSARMIGYVAGTVADKLPATVKAQTEEILGKIDALLAAAGSSNPD